MSSIIVSFILIPSLSARIDIKIKKKRQKTLFKRGKFFPFLLRYPLLVILPIIFLFIFSYKTFKEEVSFGQFFSWYSKDMIRVTLTFPAGSEFEDVKKSILKFEKVALAKAYPKEINTDIYTRWARMKITFPEEIENSAYPIQLKQELVSHATDMAGIGVFISGFDQEPYYYNPDTGSFLSHNVHIKGYNFEKLMELSKELKRNLLSHRRIKEAEIQTDKDRWWGGKQKYYSLKIDREKLKQYQLSLPNLLNIIFVNLRDSSGIEQKIKFNDKELSVEIKADGVEDRELDDLLNLNVETISGIPFRIKDVAEVELTRQKGGITREDQEYWSMVQWEYMGSAKSADRYHKTIYKNLSVPVGFTKSLEERRFRMTEEEEAQLDYAIILSVVLIYLILAMLYENLLQPLLIMLAIPLALIGVYIAFWQVDYSFDASANVGVILLFGIVVNNAILLIDNINRHLRKTSKVIESIVVGTKERIRPILMTTLTTVFGMMPLLIITESGGKGDIWTNLALCTVGGLTTSALLILFVLPIFYFLIYRFQKHIFRPKEKPTVVSTQAT
jgi:HAE1 family hydrophobic/amphiphilic exporter-1